MASVGQAALPVSVTVMTVDGVGSVTLGEDALARDENGGPLGEVTVGSADPADAPPTAIRYTLSEEEWAGLPTRLPRR